MNFIGNISHSLIFTARRGWRGQRWLAFCALCIAAVSLAYFDSRRAPTAQAAALSGEAAIQQLKRDGGYASLAAALAAARAQTSAASEQATQAGAILTQQQKLTAADGAPDDRFGTAVALSGNTAVIGVPQDDVTFANQGSAYVFVRNGTSWSPPQRLTASEPAAGDRFEIGRAHV